MTRHAQYKAAHEYLEDVLPVVQQGPSQGLNVNVSGNWMVLLNSSSKHVPSLLYWIEIHQVHGLVHDLFSLLFELIPW